MIDDIRVVEWVEEHKTIGDDGTSVSFTKERYDIQVKYHGTDVWVPLQRVSKKDTE
jgi:hypothetical protein